MSNERITENEVRNERLREINQTAHWTYLFGVLLGALVLMALFMALLDRALPSK